MTRKTSSAVKEVTLPPVVGIKEAARMFGVAETTAYMWRSETIRGLAANPMPDPAATVSGTPVWAEQTLREWGEKLGKTYDPDWRTRA